MNNQTSAVGQLGGLPVFVSDHVVEATQERLFPESRHRSNRIRKKLIKRFGIEFKMVPCIFQSPQGFYMHPKMWEKVKLALIQKSYAPPASRSETICALEPMP
jgi:hypothetical protein